MNTIVGAVAFCVFTTPAFAQEKPLKTRVETNIRAGTERSILMTEAWIPLAQERDRVLYGDVRLMGDDGDNREWNVGAGYRQLTDDAQAIKGVHGWVDRRRSKRGSVFYQVTGGFEYLSDGLDVRLNGYVPFNTEERYAIAAASTTPYLADTGIFYDTPGILVEKSLHGIDLEFSVPVPYLQGDMESFRVSVGGFAFKGSDVPGLQGGRVRVAADITSDFQLGARFEADNLRGQQGFLEATLRFPFGSKSSVKTLGLRGRLDESPERDIDVITAANTAVAPVVGVTVFNAADGMAQRVFHVDNSVAANGDGSLNNPFNNLADANAAADRNGDVIYVRYGDGTSTGMNQGVTLAHGQQSLIGSGTDFVYDSGRYTTASGNNFSGVVLQAATLAPTITNVNPGGDGVTLIGEETCVAGVTIDGAARHGIFAQASGGSNLGTLMVHDVTLRNNGADGLRIESNDVGSQVDAMLTSLRVTDNTNGIRLYAHGDGAASGSLEDSIVTANEEHGVILYDDSIAGAVTADLGGGGVSAGRNSFYGNGLEDIAIDLDGGALAARNNWWGQASGLYQANPSGALKPQIYYGAPLNDGLVGHWTMDAAWTSNTTAFDRSGSGYNGVLTGGLNLDDLTTGQHGDGLRLNGTSEYIRISGIAQTFTQYTVMSWVSPDKTTAGNADQNLYGFTVLSDGAALQGTLPYPAWLTVRNGEAVARTFNTSNTGTASIGGNVGNGEWTSIDLSSTRGGQSAIYIDGALNRTFNNPGNSSGWISGEMYIGELRAGRGLQYDGVIDDVRLYNRILSAAEIAELHRMDTTSTLDSGAAQATDPNL